MRNSPPEFILSEVEVEGCPQDGVVVPNHNPTTCCHSVGICSAYCTASNRSLRDDISCRVIMFVVFVWQWADCLLLRTIRLCYKRLAPQTMPSSTLRRAGRADSHRTKPCSAPRSVPIFCPYPSTSSGGQRISVATAKPSLLPFYNIPFQKSLAR